MEELPLNIELISEKKKQVVDSYGSWTAHNVHLAGDVYTMGKFIHGDEYPLRRIVQIISDVMNEPFSQLRILDLGCLEGQYAIEPVRHGAQAVGIDIREASLAKARLVKELLSLDRLELVQDDVRNVSAAKYGLFDVVLCLGILYHLDVPEVIEFVYQLADVCNRCLIIDTHISMADEISFTHAGKTYWGRYFREHADNATAEDKQRDMWCSIDNVKSFWFTRPSLLNLLSHAGFTSIYECHSPPELLKYADRLTLVAIKGQRQKLFSAPLVSDAPVEDWPEHCDSRFVGPNLSGFPLSKARTILRKSMNKFRKG